MRRFGVSPVRYRWKSNTQSRESSSKVRDGLVDQMTKPHSIEYIRQLMDWGFDKEFIAKDAGIDVSSLEVRLRRAKLREQDEHQGDEPTSSSDLADSG